MPAHLRRIYFMLALMRLRGNDGHLRTYTRLKKLSLLMGFTRLPPPRESNDFGYSYFLSPISIKALR